MNFETTYRFQPNVIPTKLKRNYTCENFSSITCNLNKFCGIFEEKKLKNTKEGTNTNEIRGEESAVIAYLAR